MTARTVIYNDRQCAGDFCACDLYENAGVVIAPGDPPYPELCAAARDSAAEVERLRAALSDARIERDRLLADREALLKRCVVVDAYADMLGGTWAAKVPAAEVRRLLRWQDGDPR